MRYYVNPNGTYAGAWWNGQPEVSSGLTEVPTPPEHMSQVWNGSAWADTDATTEWRLAGINDAVKSHLDSVATNLGYDDMATAITYASDDTNPAWQAEAIALRKFRGVAWMAVNTYLDATPNPTQTGALAAVPQVQSVVGFENYRAMILRRAADIAPSDPAAALLLRQSVA